MRPRERRREDELRDLEARQADLQDALDEVSEAVKDLRARRESPER